MFLSVFWGRVLNAKGSGIGNAKGSGIGNAKGSGIGFGVCFSNALVYNWGDISGGYLGGYIL